MKTQLILRDGKPVGTFDGITGYVWDEYLGPKVFQGLWETGPNPLGWLEVRNLTVTEEKVEIGNNWGDFMDSIKPRG